VFKDVHTDITERSIDNTLIKCEETLGNLGSPGVEKVKASNENGRFAGYMRAEWELV
jgi:hypothetical protein